MMTLDEVSAATYLTWLEKDGTRVHARRSDEREGNVFVWSDGGMTWYATDMQLYAEQGRGITDLREDLVAKGLAEMDRNDACKLFGRLL